MKLIVQTALLSLGALVVLGSPVAQQEAGEPNIYNDYSNTNNDYYNNDEAAFGQRDEQYPQDDGQIQEISVDQQQQEEVDPQYQDEEPVDNQGQDDTQYYPSDAPGKILESHFYA